MMRRIPSDTLTLPNTKNEEYPQTYVNGICSDPPGFRHLGEVGTVTYSVKILNKSNYQHKDVLKNEQNHADSDVASLQTFADTSRLLNNTRHLDVTFKNFMICCCCFFLLSRNAQKISQLS